MTTNWPIPPKTCIKNGFTYDRSTFQALRASFSESRKELFQNLIDHSMDLDGNPQTKCKLFSNQIEVLKYILSEIYYLALLHNAIGSGKTTLVPIIANWLAKKNYLKSGAQMIFTCPLFPVIYEIAEICLGLDIPFAFAFFEEKDEVVNVVYMKSTDHSLSINPPSDVSLIICDPFVAYQILFVFDYNKKTRNRSIMLAQSDNTREIEKAQTDIILFYDEATYCMDQRDGIGCHLFTKIFLHLMKIAPPRTILASATMPSISEMPDFYQKIAKKYVVDSTQVNQRSFTSSDFQIGCHLIGSDGNYYLPHEGIKSIRHLNYFFKQLETTPFLNRFYTPMMVKKMIYEALKFGISIEEKLREFDLNPDEEIESQMTAQKIAKQILSSFDEDDLEKFTSIKFEHNYSTITGAGKNTEKITYATIIGKQKNDFGTGTLIVGSNCLKIAQDFLAEVDKYFPNFGNFDPVKEYEEYKRLSEKVQKEKEKRKVFMRDAKEQAEYMESSSGLQWKFPLGAQLMTSKHLDSGVGGYYERGHPKLNKYRSQVKGALPFNPSELDDIIHEMKGFKWIIKLLLHGVGIYSSYFPNILSKRYLEKVLSLFRRDVIRIIISDGSIAYGTNLSFNNLIVNENTFEKKSIVDNHSLKTMFQLMGRVGRTGLSNNADIYVITDSDESKLVEKIRAHINGEIDPDGTHDEIRNLNLGLRNIWPDILGQKPIDRYLFFSEELVSGI